MLRGEDVVDTTRWMLRLGRLAEHRLQWELFEGWMEDRFEKGGEVGGGKVAPVTG
jgi:hypothetical protein